MSKALRSNGLCWWPFVLLAIATACHHDRITAPPEASYTVSVAGGDFQRAPAGSVLPVPLSVVIRDPFGVTVKSVTVIFRVTRGATTGARMLDSVGVTTTDGVASAQLQLGSTLDTTVVTAFPAAAPQRSAVLHATSTVAPALLSVTPASFSSGDTVTLAGSGLAGGAVEFGGGLVTPLAGATGTQLRALAPACMAPGSISVDVAVGPAHSNMLPATYQLRTVPLALAPFTAVTVPSAQLATCMTLAGNGATYLAVAQFAAVGTPTDTLSWHLGASGGPGVATGAAQRRGAPPGGEMQRELDARMRSAERFNAPRARAQAAAMRANRPLLALAPAVAPPLGSQRTFHVIAALDGSSFNDVTARLAFVGTHLLVYADTASNGFTNAQLALLGAHFDQTLYPIAVSGFGSESDVDGDGRIVVLFTPKVNALVSTQDCGPKGYISGFFNPNDVLLDNPGSNKAEIFYGFVPDTAGVYSCAHDSLTVMHVVVDAFMHEMQHMISYNQHVLARGGDPEETWLGEGLSHISEELASRFYEAKFPAPLGRSTTEQIFPDSAGPFIQPILFATYIYLNAARAHSVTSFTGGGSIEEQGASWLFLHWLGSQKGDDFFRQLVQTSRTGVANIEASAGETFGALFGDFTIAVWADSLPGLPRSVVPPRFQFGTRNLRTLMAREATISEFPDPFPLPLFALNVPGFLESKMIPGTMTHALLSTQPGGASVALQFTVPGGAAFPPALGAQVSVFRLPP